MRGLFVLTVLVVFALVDSNSAVSCDNPIFNRCSGNFFCNVAYLSNPVAKPNTRICPDIAVNSQSCCNQEVYDDIASAWLIGRKDIQDSVDEFVSGRQYVQEIVNNFQTIIDEIPSTYPNLSPDQQNQLKSVFITLRDSIGTLLNSAAGNWAKCASSLLNYWAGLICFGCSPDWNLYVHVNASTSRNTLHLSTDTCTSVSGQCIPLFQSLVDYVNVVTTAFNKFANLTNASKNSIGLGTLTSIKSLCNGSCSSYICDSWLSGLDFQSPFSGSDDYDDSSYEFTPKRSNEEKQSLEEQLVKHVYSIVKVLRTVSKVNARMERSMAQRSSSSFDVAYYNDGLRAYENGKSSGLDTSVSGASSAAAVWSWVQLFL